ncbi:hypothetical protein [Candidatus Galacturonibacter soehngenii]|uniref:CopG family transcriptional regulator n=1 Tax=Candidatus Galacturonatibacter soehngenii TaxID=2307010 RepID=A0A7V7QIC4_9FIRM|nr:hypothetical protein [Candidatus Galacturonibacter soehngenii]KAB1435957.1 hypothetical protein F7O84_16425 [Candidatus Galacturonibacter soehngenii]
MIRNTNIRFYEEEEEDKRAWEILHALDKKQFKSQSKFVVFAILDYYEKCMKQEQDPYFEIVKQNCNTNTDIFIGN